jgi:PTS system nitrogen regulatory IIA component
VDPVDLTLRSFMIGAKRELPPAAARFLMPGLASPPERGGLIVDRFGELLARLGFPLVDLPETAAGPAEAVIRFLVAQLVAAGRLDAEHLDDAINRVLAREHLGSTAIGNGVALPHTTVPWVSGVVGIGTRSAAGVPWTASGQILVHRICLILAPPDRPRDYLRVLDALSQGLRPKNG